MSGEVSAGIAMCTFNGARFVREQLDSIIAQTRLPDQIVVVDDRSTDDTVDILNNFAGSSPVPVRVVVNEKHLDFVKNFEKAMCLCDQDIIFFCDQDDVWYARKVGTVCDAFEADAGVGLVLTDADVCDESGQPVGCTMWQTVPFGNAEWGLVSRGRAFEALLRRHIMYGFTMAFRGSYVDRLLPIPHEHFGHDSWVSLVIAAIGNVQMIREPMGIYRRHSSAVSTGGVKTFSQKKAIAQSNWATFYAADRARYTLLMDRLERLDPQSDAWREILKAKIEHAEARASMPKNRLLRLRPVLSELFNGRYARFSRGILSAGLDLIQKS